MKVERKNIFISDSIGSVTTELVSGAKVSCMMILAHGAGAGMDHKFMRDLAESLAIHGIASLRFNFPFIENKKKRVDPPAIAHKTIECVISYAKENWSNVPLIGAGKSFGGRMTSQLLSLKHDLPLQALVLYGFPLHPANTPSVDRAVHLRDVKVPMMFLQGTKDALAYPDLIDSVCSSLPNAHLVMLDGADHSFKVGKKDAIGDLSTKTVEYLISLQIL